MRPCELSGSKGCGRATVRWKIDRTTGGGGGGEANGLGDYGRSWWRGGHGKVIRSYLLDWLGLGFSLEPLTLTLIRTQTPTPSFLWAIGGGQPGDEKKHRNCEI